MAITYSQQNPEWSELPLGFSTQTIGYGGCLITSIGNLLGLNPNEVNEKLKAVEGFAAPQNSDQKNLVIWAKIAEAFPPVSATRVWAYNDEDVRNNAGHVLVEVSSAPIGGGKDGKHWIIFKGDEECIDPWTGTIRPYGDFPDRTGYAIINNIPVVEVITEAPVETPVVNSYKGINLDDPESVKAAIDGWEKLASGQYMLIADHEATINSIASNLGVASDVDVINQTITDLKNKPAETVEVTKEVPADPSTLIDPAKAAAHPQVHSLWHELLSFLKLEPATPDNA